MPAKTIATAAKTWARVLRFEKELAPAAARALLEIQFSKGDRDRMDELSAKARDGALTQRETAEIETYEQLGCVLDILHSQARRALKRRRNPL